MLERNRVYLDDCLEGITAIDSHTVRLILTDPPYFLGMTHNGQRGSFVDLAICKPFYRQLFNEYKRVLRPDGQIYFFTDWRGLAFYYPLFESILGCDNLIVWDKLSGPGTKYRFTHEMILWHSADPKLERTEANIWRSKGFGAGAKATNGEKVHPTQKPVELFEKVVIENTDPGDLVLDTFGGSGTTAKACRRHGRDWIIFELDEWHHATACRRAAEVQSTDLFTQKRPS